MMGNRVLIDGLAQHKELKRLRIENIILTTISLMAIVITGVLVFIIWRLA